MRRYSLELLGYPRLLDAGQSLHLPTRKSLALLTYLALEPGLHGRARLAGLLWPDLEDPAARAALRKALTFIRGSLPGALHVERQAVGLDPDAVACDALLLCRAAHDPHATESELRTVSGLYRGEFLEGFSLGDAAAFDDWALTHREVCRRGQASVLERLVALQATPGATLEAAQRWVALDPLDETAVRALMRAHYQQGDRAAALAAFGQLRDALQRELGMPPLPQTLSLAQELERAGSVQLPVTAPREVPLVFLRPPQLVGRERAWEQLQQAEAHGQAVFVVGAAGAGKTRLATDFAASRGACRLMEGRPGDAGVPYATQVRALRRDLAGAGMGRLDPWARRELARLLPELETTASDATGEPGKVRLLEAIHHASRTGPPATLVVDDLQFADAASVEALLYVWARQQPQGLVCTYRTGELPPAVQATVQGLLDSGQAVTVELEPLDAPDVTRLLTALELPGGALAERLTRYTGGNPLFILETLRGLAESGALAETLRSGQLTAPGRLLALIARRLERLSPGASRLVLAAAVLGSEFRLDHLAALLDLDPLDLAAPLAELEAAQVLRRERFTHDLLLEAAHSAAPAALRTHLHRRAFQVLERAGAPSGVLAGHALAAGLTGPGFRHSLAAGQHAVRHLLAMRDGLTHLLRARELLQAATVEGDLSVRTLEELHCLIATACEHLDDLPGARRAHADLRALAERSGLPAVRAHAYFHDVKLALYDGLDLSTADRAAASAVQVSRSAGDEEMLMHAYYTWAEVHAWRHDFTAALECASEAQGRAVRRADRSLEAEARFRLADALTGLGRWMEAEREAEAALEARVQVNGQTANPAQLAIVARARLHAGRAADAVRVAREAASLSRDSGSPRNAALSESLLGAALLDSGEPHEALASATRAEQSARRLPNPLLLGRALLVLGAAHVALGQAQAAQAAFEEALAISEHFSFRPLDAVAARGLAALAGARQDRVAAGTYALQALAAPDHSWYGPGNACIVQALLQAGYADQAREEVTRRARHPGSPRHQLDALRSRARYHAHHDEFQLARADLELAATIAGRLGLPAQLREVRQELRALHGHPGGG